jgi:hypothetical protein
MLMLLIPNILMLVLVLLVLMKYAPTNILQNLSMFEMDKSNLFSNKYEKSQEK